MWFVEEFVQKASLATPFATALPAFASREEGESEASRGSFALRFFLCRMFVLILLH
jgi:hypothetical protein